MRILISAKPKSKTEYVKRATGANFVVAVKEAPEKGKANQAIIKALAEFFDIQPASVKLIFGQTSKQKIFEIPLTPQDLERIPDSPGQMKLL